MLELFHGPTAAFKDVGARFLAALMERALPLAGSGRAAADDSRRNVRRHRRRGRGRIPRPPGIRVGVLFPKGQVSPRQQHQLTCWGGNVRAFEIDGTFDDCQALVKAAFTDAGLRGRHRLTAANSINIGRLLPQMAYHAAASLWHWRSTARPRARSCRPVTLVTAWRASGRARWACRSARSCSR